MDVDVNKKLLSMQEISKAMLSRILCTVSSTKYIVLDPSIIRPLERVCGVQWLKSNGLEKIFRLEATTPSFGDHSVFYMIFSTFATFKQVVDQIRSQVEADKPVKNIFHIIVVPHYFHHFEKLLEELGLIHSVIELHSFHWLPLHLDVNILSLELPNIYKSLYLQLDYNYLRPLAKSLWNLLFVIGKPKFILSLGENADKILHQVDLLEEDKEGTDRLEPDIGGLIIFDRNLDYPSALLTPGTYTALLNEVYGINCGVCEYKEADDALGQPCLNPVPKKQPVKFALNSEQDEVYADIRNRYFTEVTSVLSILTKQLKNENVQSKEMALDEMKRYIQKQLQATRTRKKCIANHLLAAETIVNVLGSRYETQQEIECNILNDMNKSANFAHLEEALCVENDRYICLRLFCLLCITQKLSETEMKSFWRKFQHQFGFSSGFAYRYLSSAGFVADVTPTDANLTSKMRLGKFGTKEFYGNANKFKQIPQKPDKINLKHPTCASYVFGGAYIPLITQIASMILNAVPIDEIKSKLSGLGTLTLRNDNGFPLQARSLLIYVIGGVTYAEFAACNLLQTLTGSKIVIMSDKVVSGNDLMKQVLD